MKAKKLRACPFCGSRAEVRSFEPDPERCTGGPGFPSYCVVCQGCGVAGPCGGTFEEGKEKAIKLWNRRSRPKPNSQRPAWVGSWEPEKDRE